PHHGAREPRTCDNPRHPASWPDVRQDHRQGRRTHGRGGAVMSGATSQRPSKDDFSPMSEADWEESALDLLGEQGWFPLRGKEVAPGSGERESWTDLVLPDRLLDGLQRLNPQVPVPHLREAAADILRITSTDAITENHR